MLQTKLEAQARLAERLLVYRPSERANRKKELTIPQAIRAQCAVLRESNSSAELRRIESIAGRYYWQTFAHLPIKFDREQCRGNSATDSSSECAPGGQSATR
jgi:CRISPR/Cas system-associated endonuclease Cas1